MVRAWPPLHLVSWRQHRSIPLREIVSTTSLALPLKVPTLSVATLNESGRSVDSLLKPDVATPRTPRATLPETFLEALLLRLAMNIEACFTVGCSSCHQLGHCSDTAGSPRHRMALIYPFFQDEQLHSWSFQRDVLTDFSVCSSSYICWQETVEVTRRPPLGG